MIAEYAKRVRQLRREMKGVMAEWSAFERGGVYGLNCSMCWLPKCDACHHCHDCEDDELRPSCGEVRS